MSSLIWQFWISSFQPFALLGILMAWLFSLEMLARIAILGPDDEKSRSAPRFLRSLPLLFFRRTRPEENKDDVKSDTIIDEVDFARIRCPLCKWHPSRSSRWICGRSGPPENYEDGCGTRWNTFETGGVCPGCDHRWVWTACQKCHEFSRHADWYEENSK